MEDDHRFMRCPGCSARLFRFVDVSDDTDGGVAVCEHGHIFDPEDPDDDRALCANIGADYRTRLLTCAQLR